jgi:EmrB/QacA subfamily drug resistance transporter
MTEKLAKEELTTLFVVCIATFLFSFSFFSIHIALPAIQSQFGISLAAVQWVSIIGNVLSCSLSLCLGRLGDRFGRNSLYKSGVALYAVGSGLCALAGSFPQLIVFRILMTTGLAMAFPLTGAILVSRFPSGRRGRALGILGTAMAVGRISGPTLGGMILALSSWRGIFLASSIIGAGASVAAWTLLSGKDQRRKESFDIWGSLAFFICYPALLIALSLSSSWGWWSFPVFFFLIISVLGWTSFLVIEFRFENPLVRPALFRNRSMTVALVYMIIAWTVFSPIFILAPMYLRNVLTLPPLTIGLILTLPPLFFAVLSPLSGWIADKTGGRSVVTVGLGLILVGIYCYSQWGPLSTYGWIALTLILIGSGSGLFQPANQRMAFSSVSERDYGVVSAMLFSFGQAAGSLGTAVAVAIIEGRLGTKEIFSDPTRFAEAQQFTFHWFLPLAALGLLLSFAARSKPVMQSN